MRHELKFASTALVRCAPILVMAGLIHGCASFPTMSVAPERRAEAEGGTIGDMVRNRPGPTAERSDNIMTIPGLAPATRTTPATPPATREEIARLVPDEPINATLPPQPLAQYLNTAFTEILKVPYSLGPDIAARNTVITVNAPPSSSKQAYLMLLQDTLRNYGLTLSVRNNAVLIADDTGGGGGSTFGPNARPQIIRSRSAADTPANGRVVQIFQLVALQATPELVSLAQRIAGFGGGTTVQVDPAANALSIEGQGRQVAAMVNILSSLDQPAYAGAQVARLEPVYQSSTDFAANLQSALTAEGYIVSSDPLGPKSIMIVPLISTNQTLVFTADKATMARVQFWASQIDSPTAQGDQSSTFVYEVRNTSAVTVGQMLINAGAQANQAARPGGVAFPGAGGAQAVIGGQANRVGGVAINQNANRANAGRGGIGTQQVGGGNAGRGGIGAQQVGGGGGANRAVGTNAISNVNRVATNTQAVVGNAPTGGLITVDDAGNRILFTGSAPQFAQLRSLLQRLDVPAREVLVEVTVAEVTLTDETRAGLEFFFNASYHGDPISGGTGSFPAPGAPFTGSGAGQAGTGLGLGTAGATFNFAGADLRAAFNAFASNNKVNVLSRPHLTAKSGYQAQIQVGDEVPIITSQRAASTTTGGNTDTLQTVQYRQTGVILTITPIIYGDDRVDLTITQEVSDVRDNPNAAIGSPIIGSRTVTTTLTLADGRSAILGGLMEDSFGKSNRGVPFFKDVPLLGQAFRTDIVSGRKTELVVLITPLIIRNSDDMSNLANQITNDMNRAFEVGRGASYTLTPYPLGGAIGINPPNAMVVGGATLRRPPAPPAEVLTPAPTPAPPAPQPAGEQQAPAAIAPARTEPAQ
jgi:general secretion pathway protein D